MDERFQVAVLPLEWHFEAAPGRPLLISARQAGIVLPSSCRNGTCRTCICKMESGSVHYEIEWPGLSAQEKADGYILPCVAYPRADLVIDAPEAERKNSASESGGAGPVGS